MKKINFLFFPLLFCFFINNTKAQPSKSRTGFATTINGYSCYTPAANFTDTIGNMQYKQLGAGIILPLYGHIATKDTHAAPHLFQLFFNSGFTVGYPDINFKYTLRPRTLYDASSGLTALYYFGKNNTLLGGVYGFVSEDQITIQQPEARFGSFFLFNHYIQKSKLSYKVGAFYSYLFGRAIPLPLIGFTKDFSEKSHLSVILPLNLSYRYTLNDKQEYTFFIKPRGYINNFSNELQDIQFNDGKIPIIQTRRTHIKIGIEEKIQLHPNCMLKAEVGVLTYRNLAFFYEASNTNNSLFATDISTQGYVQFVFSWKINKKKREGKGIQHKSSHPSFIDFSNFDLDNLDLNDLHFEGIQFENININDIDMDDIDEEDIIEQID